MTSNTRKTYIRPVRFIQVSSRMFKMMIERAQRIAEDQFQRETIDMPPKDAAKIHDAWVEAFVDCELQRIGNAAGVMLDKQDDQGLEDAARAFAEQGGA